MTSLLYPGNTLSQAVLQEAVWASERVLHIHPLQRAWITLRMDAGFGTDHNLHWALRQGYQVVAKNNSGRRAGVWGERVQDWQVIVPDQRWVALSPEPLEFGVPTRTLAVRWRDHHTHKLKHALYVVTDLHHSLPEVCQMYDLRGGLEVDIRDDKQGLLLTHRRKRYWYAQETLVLLNDLAHNLLSMFRRGVLADTPLAQWGPYRLIRDVLAIPGEAILADDQLVALRLAQSHPLSAILVEVLPRLWQ